MSDTTELKGVILAAGKGTRIKNLRTRLPKPVLPIANEPIIYGQMRLMKEVGIRDVTIMVGHYGYEVVRQIERMPSLGLEINYVQQTETLGIAHCVGFLEAHLNSPFLLFLGDIYLMAPRIPEMVSLHRKSETKAVLGSIVETNKAMLMKNYCIVPGEDGLIKRVIEKPRYPSTDIKGVGVYLFDPVIFDAIRRTPRTAMRDEYEITDSIQIMIDFGYPVTHCTCATADFNVTYPEDLLRINLDVLRASGLSNLLDPEATVEPEALIKNSIVGRRAVIGRGAKVLNSLVFPGATVPPGAELDGAVVTEQGVNRI